MQEAPADLGRGFLFHMVQNRLHHELSQRDSVNWKTGGLPAPKLTTARR